MTDEQKAQRAVPTFLEAASRAGHLVAVFAAVAYGLGLTIANLHFGKFGNHSFGLIRTSYVTAGLWAILIMWFAIAAIVLFRVHTSRIQEKGRARVMPYIRKIATYCFFGFAVVHALAQSLKCSTGALVIAVLTGISLIAALFVYTGGLLRKDGGEATGHPSEFFALLRQRISTVPYALPWLLGTLIGFLAAVATMWGQLPVALGGGRPTSVVVGLDSAHVSRAILARGSLVLDSAWAVSGFLITRESDYFVIAPYGRRSSTLIPLVVRQHSSWTQFEPR
ncbi:MAG: hypothetical protein ACRD1T_08005 [Acidimicrobiia bacterium]